MQGRGVRRRIPDPRFEVGRNPVPCEENVVEVDEDVLFPAAFVAGDAIAPHQNICQQRHHLVLTLPIRLNLKDIGFSPKVDRILSDQCRVSCEAFEKRGHPCS